MEFGTISVSDGISMGHEGMRASLVSREVIADSVETVMFAERLDGSVTLAGCDKSLPGMLMAAARLDLASVLLYAGSTLPGKLAGLNGVDRDLTIIDVFEGVGALARGLITKEELDAIERATCPGQGACGGMYTANTMASAGEALGMSLPGSAAPPAVDARRTSTPSPRRGGRPARGRRHHRPPDPHQGGLRERHHRRDGARRLDQRRAAPARDRPRGARRPDVRRLLPDRDEGAAPGDVKPFGRYVMTDIDRVGGIPVVMKALLDVGLLHGDTLTCTGRTMAENLEALDIPPLDGEVLRALGNPMHRTGGISILHGSLAPEGAVVKSAGFDAQVFEGNARVFDGEQGCMDAVVDGTLQKDDVCVIRYEGPRAGRACARCSWSPAPSRAPGSARTCCC
jgi:dihydroxy-acid dehydratase